MSKGKVYCDSQIVLDHLHGAHPDNKQISSSLNFDAASMHKFNSECDTHGQVLANPSSFDVAVTTYDMIGSKDLGNSMSRTITWRYLILDEGHKIKNELTQVAQRMRHVRWASHLLYFSLCTLLQHCMSSCAYSENVRVGLVFSWSSLVIREVSRMPGMLAGV